MGKSLKMKVTLFPFALILPALLCGHLLEASPYGRLLHRVPTRVASRTDACCIAMQQKMFGEIVLFFLLSQ